ncbi:hypothetical protein EC973_004445 [Apophysomyces ossiformis]|uniref:C2 domain-containing protein n=1 Tax=Apophysomyces ossiformis TaxID=679940 RepID=A0A8H7BSG7_9FUNG|nr:hypothetical protein EC973_004445 [Apophysomyces ossiformis]
MFGRSNSNRGATPVQSKDIHIEDIDSFITSSLNDIDHLDDSDLNDPDLLRQLQELSSPSGDPQAVKQPKSRKSEVHAHIDFESYAALVQGEDIDVQLTEEDYNDPALLKELAALCGQGNDTSAVPETVHITKDKTEVAVVSEPSSSDESLSRLVDIGFSQQQSLDALALHDNDVEKATAYLLKTTTTVPAYQDTLGDMVATNEYADETQPKTPTTGPDPADNVSLMNISSDTAEEKTGITSNTPEELKAQAMAYQKEALAVKKQGDKKKAVALLRQSKVLMQQYNDMIQSPTETDMDTRIDDHDSAKVNLPENESTIAVKSPSNSFVDNSGDTASSKTETSATPDVEKTHHLLDIVIQRQKEYKQAAIHYKKIGNLAVAKDMIQKSKELLRVGIQIKKGEIPLDVVDILPEPDMTLGDGKLRHISSVIGPTNHTYDQLEAQLKYQIDVCHNLYVQSKGKPVKSQSKTMSSSDSRDQMLRLQQAYAVDLLSLKAHHDQDANAPIPALHYEHVDYTYKNLLDQIPANQMQLKIVRASGLQNLHLTTVDPYITFDFCGWPPENTAQAAQGKGETPVRKGSEPEAVFDFSTLIPIARTNRTFIRHVERKKLVLEVFHNKYSYGFFKRPVSLGKVSIPLDPLLRKTSIAGSFDLVDAGRKKTGGKVEIEINLREPLKTEDLVKRSERWLVIDAFNSNVSQLLGLAGLTSTPYQPIPLVNPSSSSTPLTPAQPQSALTPAASTKARAITPAPVSEASETPTELEQAEEELNNVDNIVSNMVLEHEISLVTAALQKSSATDDLLDRKQALDIKMNMLVIQVQTGMLDMDTYLNMVQKRMQRDRHLALLFKKHGRMDLAKLALIRKKIMQDEIDEARAAMAGQG